MLKVLSRCPINVTKFAVKHNARWRTASPQTIKQLERRWIQVPAKKKKVAKKKAAKKKVAKKKATKKKAAKKKK